MTRWVILAAIACACSGGKAGPSNGSNGGSGNPTPGAPCEAIRAKVEGLYRAEAQVKEPKRVEEAVADNTAMVLAECAKAPVTVGDCVSSAATVAALETNCLAPLDDEGTEGEALRK